MCVISESMSRYLDKNDFNNRNIIIEVKLMHGDAMLFKM